jgi:histidine triad (HIT) family protein
VLPCLYCESAAGDLPQAVVYEDGQVVAFLDWRQTAPGHVLVLPRRHLSAEEVFAGPVGAALMAAVVRVARAVREVVAPAGVQMGAILFPGGQPDRRVSGRLGVTPELPMPTAEEGHFHLHVLPREHRGEVARIYPFGDEVGRQEELAAIAERIRAALRRAASTDGLRP